jgi:hypothetical protein
VAEEAVSSEPVSKIPEFPANREINRENIEIRAFAAGKG